MKSTTKIVLGVCLAYFQAFSPQVLAQTANQTGFEQSTAILDTNVLFAIGAREADQAIRGAFGWPTFQEGFVEGVYFRFDPDGYARFSPSPRLDEDVFEIICAKASTACIAKKNVLEIGLTPSGEVQIQLSGITPQDSFFVSDRKSELPLPPSILGPLAPRLEALLSGGGELLVKREVEVIQTISLVGFSAVATYLRWVSQNQSPRVFPRGWPVPAQSVSQTATGLTQPNQWIPPNSGPQQALTTWGIQQQLQSGNRSVTGRTSNPVQTRMFNSSSIARNQLQAQNGQNLASLQNQILELQKNLRGIVNDTPQSGNLEQFQQSGMQRQSDEVMDYERAFAQQARGRSLPELPGGLGVGGDSTVLTQQSRDRQLAQILPDRRLSAGGGQGDLIPSLSLVPADVKGLLNRIELLERSIYALRQDFSIQIAEIKGQISRNAVSQIAPNNGVDQLTVSSNARTPVKAPELNNSEHSRELLAKLEATLLQRLASQNQSGVIQMKTTAPSADTASVSRSALEELLGELSLQSETKQENSIDPSTEPSQNNDFVTLDSYINQVLRKEGLKKGMPLEN